MNNNKQMKTVWTIYPPSNDEKKYGKHPTQKPIKFTGKNYTFFYR